MARKYAFADEAGNLDFRRGGGATRFFVLGVLVVDDPGLVLGSDLLDLRRKLAWKGMALDAEFHASEDSQAVRDEVFRVLQGASFRLYALRLEKSKAAPQTRKSELYFYKLAWFMHLRFVANRIASSGDELLVTAAQIGTKKKRAAFRTAIDDVVAQTASCKRWEIAFWPAASDPMLQAADYCTWAVQRKHEMNDARSYSLISGKIYRDADAFQSGKKHYY